MGSELLRIVLTDQIELHLSPEQKRELEAHLTADGTPNPPFPLAKLCRNYISMMLREGDLGKLEADWVSACVHDVYFAAKGLSREERAADRMARALDRATGLVGRNGDVP